MWLYERSKSCFCATDLELYSFNAMSPCISHSDEAVPVADFLQNLVLSVRIQLVELAIVLDASFD